MTNIMTNVSISIMDMGELHKRVENGLITLRKHPILDIYICNYTSKTQYDGLWDQYTERCRGLMIDGRGHILNNPFRKFFNLGEKEYTMVENLPAEVPKITEKLDGMLGILYEEGDNVAISTRGTFDSPHAKWATNWLRLKGFKPSDFKKGYTYLFEVIYHGNRIIVNYRNRAELVLLAVRNNLDNSELDHIKEAQRLCISYAKEYSFDKVDNALVYLEKVKGTESEGFVCKYSNGLRIKIKSADYKRLHKLLTGISARHIWSSLRDTGSVGDIIENVPDEYFNWVKKVEAELIASHLEIMNGAMSIVLEAKKIGSRVEQASYIIKNTEDAKGLRAVAFFLLDDRINKADKAAWQRIKPSGDTFKRYDDENI